VRDVKGHILVVEDDPELADNLVEIMEGLDWQVDVSRSAERALELLRERSYEGVLTDFRLPGLGGVELISRLREAGAHVPVVVMSAFMDESAADQAERAGALDVLAKPVDLERLFGHLETFSRTNRLVLIVEDNVSLAENVAEALREEGLASEVAPDGLGALSRRLLPQVALIDLRLPDLNGVEVARRLLARDPTIKILFVTAHAEELRAEVERAQRELKNVRPDTACLLKPFSVPDLVRRIRQAVQ
jgi:CheY-like chemotaxis protein